jgi:hypothetical protein
LEKGNLKLFYSSMPTNVNGTAAGCPTAGPDFIPAISSPPHHLRLIQKNSSGNDVFTIAALIVAASFFSKMQTVSVSINGCRGTELFQNPMPYFCMLKTGT